MCPFFLLVTLCLDDEVPHLADTAPMAKELHGSLKLLCLQSCGNVVFSLMHTGIGDRLSAGKRYDLTCSFESYFSVNTQHEARTEGEKG